MTTPADRADEILAEMAATKEDEHREYLRGVNDACDYIELGLRRMFAKLWPHDENTAKVVNTVREELRRRIHRR